MDNTDLSAVIAVGDKVTAPTTTGTVDGAIADGADVVMPLRLQLERQESGLLPTLREYSKMYGITRERLDLANADALLLHPGPMNEGVEISPDVAHGTQSLIEEQVRNGVAVRMALLYLLVGTAKKEELKAEIQ